MSFDWREFLELARDLVGQSNAGYSSEAVKRAAVSRAYYAAYCMARNYARTRLGFQSTRSAQDHASLRDYLKRQKKGKLASGLNKLRLWRNKCDYDDHVPELDRYAQQAIILADKAIKDCI